MDFGESHKMNCEEMTGVCDDAVSLVTEVCDDAVSIVTEACDDAVSIVTEACDDVVSIITNTTKNSDDNNDHVPSYKSLFGLTILENKGIHQKDVPDKVALTDENLSPVLPVQTSGWHCKGDSKPLAVENCSDQDSVMSESLLLHTEQNYARHASKTESENQASQLLFDDNQSSGTYSEILPMQSINAHQSFSNSTESPVKLFSPQIPSTSNGQSHDLGSNVKMAEIGNLLKSSGQTVSLQATSCSSQYSGEISDKPKASHPCTSQSSGENTSVSQVLTEVNGQVTDIPQAGSEDKAKQEYASNVVNSRGCGQESMSLTSSTHSSGKDKGRCRKVDSGQDQTNSGESSQKSQNLNPMIVQVDRENEKMSSPLKIDENRLRSPLFSSVHIVTEHDREEVIFQKIIKQQNYVDKQLRTISPLLDVDKIKQHMDTLQSLLRQLSDQHKYQRHRLTADVRSSSKTKRDRLRHKNEIEQLGKRQRELIKLVQRQKTLSSKLKDLEHSNDGSGSESLLPKCPQRENQTTGSSQMAISPSGIKETRTTDTQSSMSSRLTPESYSQSLLYGYTNNNPGSENVALNNAILSLPSNGFCSRSGPNLSNVPVDNSAASPQHSPPVNERTAQVQSVSLVNKRSSHARSIVPVNEWVAQAQPITNSNENSASRESVMERSVPIQKSVNIDEISIATQASVRMEEMPSTQLRSALFQSSSIDEQSDVPTQIIIPSVSYPAETSSRNNQISSIIKAGFNVQHFDGKKTAKTSPFNIQNERILKDPSLKSVIKPNTRTSTLAKLIQPTSGKAKMTFIPPSSLKPPPYSTATLPSPSAGRQLAFCPAFKSPPPQSTCAVDNISPSTASCSDVFPVKSKEINRRIQQRRFLTENQRETTDCQMPNQVSNSQCGSDSEAHATVVLQNVTEEKSGLSCSTPIQKKYPALGTLIDRGVLVPGKDCLVTESQHGRYIGSLMDSGLIRGPGGEVFKTPVQWVSAVNDGVPVKKSRAYREVFYCEQSLLSLANPGYTPSTDLTNTIDVAAGKRTSYTEMMANSVITMKQSAFDLESLLGNCTVRIICGIEVVTSSDLPENFWSDDFSSVRLPRNLQEQIDCW